MSTNAQREWCKKYNRWFCETAHPWPGHGRAMHTEVEEIADYGDTARYKCKVCGHEWNEELPQ